jgi:folate-binding protein YgfZ
VIKVRKDINEVTMSVKSPLYELEQAGGASFEIWYSKEVVQDFGDAQDEYEAVRTGAGALDLYYLIKLKVSGPDRTRYLHNMLSNDIRKLQAGDGCYSTLLTHQGKMESDLHVYAFSREFWLECPPAGGDRALETLHKYVVGDVVQIDDWSKRYTVLSLQGPRSRQAMEQSADVSLDGLPALAHRSIPGSSGEWVIVHRDRTGLDGYDLWLPAEDAPEIWRRWSHSQAIRPVGHQALNWLRTEAGIPWFGVDMGTQHLPMEFRLDSAISTTKGCYRGQEIVTRVTHRGHLDRCLGAIAVSGGDVPPHGSAVHSEGIRIGEVTSAILSPRLRSALALVLMKRDYLRQGTPVEILHGGKSYRGEVVALPFS